MGSVMEESRMEPFFAVLFFTSKRHSAGQKSLEN
jgi:hypothetical protein